jgi:hypothetical protein
MILIRECGRSQVSWFWDFNSGDYVKRERGHCVILTADEFLEDVLNYPEATRCDGLRKWIEAGRPR